MKNILFLGDSNTYGYDPINGRYPASVRWIDVCDSLLQKKDIGLVNAGMNGREIPRSSYEVSEIEQAVRSCQCDSLAVMLGSNDILNMDHPSAKEAGKRMDAFLQSIMRDLCDVSFILVIPPQMKESFTGGFCPDQYDVQAVKDLVPVYTELAHTMHLSFINTQSWQAPLCFDGVHLSEEGHRIFARRMAEELAGAEEV